MVYSKVSSVGLLIFVYSTAATFLKHKMCRSGVKVGCASTLENGWSASRFKRQLKKQDLIGQQNNLLGFMATLGIAVDANDRYVLQTR